MRIQQLTAAVLLLTFSFIFTSCSRESLDDRNTTKEIITQGQWKVDYYFSGQDMTSQYSTVQLVFNGNGTVNGSTGIEQLAGTWNVACDASRTDILQLNLGGSNPLLAPLASSWKVTATDPLVISFRQGETTVLRMRKL